VSGRRAAATVAGILVVLSIMLTSLALLGLSDYLHLRTERIPAGALVTHDVTLVGNRVTIAGDVDADVTAMSGLFVQTGSVTGDMRVFAGRSELRGPIVGNVSVAGANILVYGVITGNVDLYGGQITLVEGSSINGNLTVHGGKVKVAARAELDGSLTGQAMDVLIEGQVDGPIDVVVRKLAFAPDSVVTGPIKFDSRSAASVDPTAQIAGTTVRTDPAGRFVGGSVFFWHSAALVRVALMVLLGTFLIAVSPRTTVEITDVLRSAPGIAFFTGVGILVFVPIALTVFGMFVVTLPAALAASTLVALCAYSSMAIVGLTLGRLILRVSFPRPGRSRQIVAMTAGVMILAAIRVVPLRAIDLVVALGTAVLGMGAVGLWIRGPGSTSTWKSGRPLPSLLLGFALGMIALILAVLAISIAVTGAVAAFATVSRNALFTWEIGPRRLAATALALGASSLMLAMAGLWLARRRCAMYPQAPSTVDQGVSVGVSD
jgi:cytoskeletal protein CcmA (bactofilin family)